MNFLLTRAGVAWLGLAMLSAQPVVSAVIEVERADALTATGDRVELSGEASVRGSGESGEFSLQTQELVGFKNESGELKRLETFGPSTLRAKGYELKSDKVYVYADPKIGQLKSLEAFDAKVRSLERPETLRAHKVTLDFRDNRLLASGQVRSSRKSQGKPVSVRSDTQVIDLDTRHLQARGEVSTDYGGKELSIESGSMALAGDMATFEEEVKLTTKDGVEAYGHKMSYDLLSRRLLIEKDARLLTETERGQVEITGDVVERRLSEAGRSLLTAWGEARLSLADRRGGGRELRYLEGDEDGYLMLLGDAFVVDESQGRLLRSPAIRLDLASEDLQAGIVGRSQGTFILESGAGLASLKHPEQVNQADKPAAGDGR